jgi:tetratricopeptide (TPR) repeat protein
VLPKLPPQLLFDSSKQTYTVHPAVRQAAQALAAAGRITGGADALAASNKRFVRFAASELNECGRLYAEGASGVIERSRIKQPLFVAMSERAVAEADVVPELAPELLGADLSAVLHLSETLGLAATSSWLGMARALRARAPEQQRTSATALLAQALRISGKYEEAEPLYKEAWEARRRALGEDHRDTVSSISGLGMCLYLQGCFAESEQLLRKALDGRKSKLGAEHPMTLASIHNYAACLVALGKCGDAEKLHRQALAGRQRVLGEEHPETLDSVFNLAVCLEKQGSVDAAVKLYTQASLGRRSALGEEHPDTLASAKAEEACRQKSL